MKFGQVERTDGIDLKLPPDHPGTAKTLERMASGNSGGTAANAGTKSVPAGNNLTPGDLQLYIGCAKWNRQDLKNFYPRGTKDELTYYATQFNAVEMNATFYRYFPEDQVRAWVEKVPEGFRFFPKIHQDVSHRKWLNNIEGPVDHFVESVSHFQQNLGTVFLQLRDNFASKFMDRLARFLDYWPSDIPLAVELRHPEWFQEPVAEELYSLLDNQNVANILVDTAGRRDLMHMRLTGRELFVRYVGANDKTDYDRLDEWADRLQLWIQQGLHRIHFFVHQNNEVASPALSAHFIRRLNQTLDLNIRPPQLPKGTQPGLF